MTPHSEDRTSSQAPAANAAELRRLRALVNNSPLVVFAKDLEGRYTVVNRALEDLWGMSREELLGRSDFDLWPAFAAEYTVNDDKVLSTLSVIRTEEHSIVDGEEQTWRSVKFPLRDETGRVTGIGGVSQNITADRRREQRLEDAQGELEKLNAELSQFAAMAAHDLASPLHVVVLLLRELREDHAGGLDADGMLLIDRALDESARMRSLIEDLVDFARSDLPPESRPVDLEIEVRTALQTLGPSVAEAEAVVQVGPLPVVLGDALRLRRVLQNLVANAVKYRDPRRRLQVDIRSRHLGRQCRISVIDNGRGIAADELPRVFDAFFRSRSSRRETGAGLGLAFCRRVVEAHGGRIWATSTPGEGTSIHLELPVPGLQATG